jgi:hypothetical protein
VKLNAVEAVQVEVRAGQWSTVREKEKSMEEMSLGELLYCAVVEGPRTKSGGAISRLTRLRVR